MVRGVYSVFLFLIIFYSLCIKIYLIGVFEVWDFYYFYEIDIIKYFVVFYFSVICNIVYIWKVFVGFFYIFFRYCVFSWRFFFICEIDNECIMLVYNYYI